MRSPCSSVMAFTAAAAILALTGIAHSEESSIVFVTDSGGRVVMIEWNSAVGTAAAIPEHSMSPDSNATVTRVIVNQSTFDASRVVVEVALSDTEVSCEQAMDDAARAVLVYLNLERSTLDGRTRRIPPRQNRLSEPLLVTKVLHQLTARRPTTVPRQSDTPIRTDSAMLHALARHALDSQSRFQNMASLENMFDSASQRKQASIQRQESIESHAIGHARMLEAEVTAMSNRIVAEQDRAVQKWQAESANFFKEERDRLPTAAEKVVGIGLQVAGIVLSSGTSLAASTAGSAARAKVNQENPTQSQAKSEPSEAIPTKAATSKSELSGDQREQQAVQREPNVNAHQPAMFYEPEPNHLDMPGPTPFSSMAKASDGVLHAGIYAYQRTMDGFNGWYESQDCAPTVVRKVINLASSAYYGCGCLGMDAGACVSGLQSIADYFRPELWKNCVSPQ